MSQMSASSEQRATLLTSAMRTPNPAAYLTEHGVAAFDLEAAAKVIFPVITPLVNIIPRRCTALSEPMSGADYTVLSAGQPAAEDVAAKLAAGSIRAGTIPDAGEGDDDGGDSRARGLVEALVALKIVEERFIIEQLLAQAYAMHATADTLGDLDTLLSDCYKQSAGDPDFLVMHPLVHAALTALMVEAGKVHDVHRVDNDGFLRAKYRVTHYLNRVTGKPISVVPNRFCPEGVIIALSKSLPHPTPGITSAVEIESSSGYFGVDAEAEDPRFTAYTREVVKVHFPRGVCVLEGIQTPPR